MAGTKTKLISLTEKATGLGFKLAADKIINFYGVNSGADSSITWVDKVSGNIRTMTVDQTPATINTAAVKTFAVTYSTGETVYIHADRIVYIADLGSTRLISYYNELSVLQQLSVSTSASAINTAAGNTFLVTLADSNQSPRERYLNCNLMGTLAAKGIVAQGAISAVAVTPGSDYEVGDTITIDGGTNTGAAELTVDTTTLIDANNLAPGSGYAAGDTIVLAGGTATTKAEIEIVKTKLISLDIDDAGTGYSINDVVTLSGGTSSPNATITVDTVGGGGEILTFHITNAGGFTVESATFTDGSPGGGTGATFENALFGVRNYNISVGGVYTAEAASFTQDSTTGSGTGATFDTTTYGVVDVSVSDAGEYTVIPSNPVSQDSTSGSGSGATFNVTWGAVGSTGTEILYDQKSGAFVSLVVDEDMGDLETTVNAL